MSKILNKDDIINAPDRETKTIHVPEWDGDVRISALTAEESMGIDEVILDEKGELKPNFMNILKVELCCRCLVGEDGERLFSKDDIDALWKKNRKAIERIATVAEKMNALNDKELAEIKKK